MYSKFKSQLLDYIDNDEALEAAPLHKLALDGELSAYQHTGFWQCADTYRELLFVENMRQQDKVPWRLW